jgi:hypothetical protein
MATSRLALGLLSILCLMAAVQAGCFNMPDLVRPET